MRVISYRGEMVAIATHDRVYLAPDVDRLPVGHPKLRFVAAMCMYSRDVDEGEAPDPYSDGWAELYARCVLIPDDKFDAAAALSDDELARRFHVPLEQIAAKRDDSAGRRRAKRTGPGFRLRDP